METVLTVLLIRFGLIVGGLVLLALVVFWVAVALKRRGKVDRIAPYAGAVARYLDGRTGKPDRGSLAGDAIRAAARRIDREGRR